MKTEHELREQDANLRLMLRIDDDTHLPTIVANLIKVVQDVDARMSDSVALLFHCTINGVIIFGVDTQ